FNKTWMYQNSRLPPGMVPFNVYLPTWTLICRAVQASMDVYTRPPKSQRQQYLDADPRRGIKATIIKSQPVDDRKLLIVAIRGSQWKLVDWTVNVAASPSPPEGFLDDEGNACHAGFLAIAKAMVPAVAAQLRRLVQEEPEWITSSMLFTGHSAGGAVASLLYLHMLSSQTSELTALAGVFKRVHCVTFGAPPVSLLPLQVPAGRAHQKNQFLSFVNEGDPVVRADRPYVMSLIKLLAEPAPSANGSRPSRLRAKLSCQALKSRGSPQQVSLVRPTWPVPEATMSTAGRLVLLREKAGSEHGAIEAVQLTDGQLRDFIFGDLTKHYMTMYKERLDELAFAAVTGR
ncbi:alpha/beta-hydrolase, partial [Teratosphaeria nubilosa]